MRFWHGSSFYAWFTQLALPNAGGCVKPQGYLRKEQQYQNKTP
jgi:hypothetical protein